MPTAYELTKIVILFWLFCLLRYNFRNKFVSCGIFDGRRISIDLITLWPLRIKSGKLFGVKNERSSDIFLKKFNSTKCYDPEIIPDVNLCLFHLVLKCWVMKNLWKTIKKTDDFFWKLSGSRIGPKIMKFELLVENCIRPQSFSRIFVSCSRDF